jgi:glucokinase
MDIVVTDIGGTHARFAIAHIAGGKVAGLDEPVTLQTGDYPSLQAAWAAFAARLGRALPPRAGIAVATPIGGDVLKMTNSSWSLRPAGLQSELGLDAMVLINDFGAVGHAIGAVGPGDLRAIAGPDLMLPDDGVVGIVGPGTGLGVAHVWRRNGISHVIESEAGHVDFAPVDSIDDSLLALLRKRYSRVSVERIVSGPGLASIHEALCTMQGKPAPVRDDAALWQAALSGAEPLAAAALQRFCLSLGSFMGDIALATGANFMVMGGGLGPRIADILPASGFAARFVAKGRMEPMLSGMPVKLLTHPHPGLLGAAAAFAAAHSG